jgi:hypothetical protein
MAGGAFAGWWRDFEGEARARAVRADPAWETGARLDPAIVRSLQRFQVGEGSDGRVLIAKAAAAGDAEYTAAIALFVAEEQNHARLLGCLLAAAGEPVIEGHWSDALFRRLRRSLGLRMELMVLLVAEVVAIPYYRAVRDGADDPLTAAVADRILADEVRHVPFHCDRLHASFAEPSPIVRAVATAGWWIVATGATLVVLYDHGEALSRLGTSRRRFAGEVATRFGDAVRRVRAPDRPSDRTRPEPVPPVASVPPVPRRPRRPWTEGAGRAGPACR